MQVDSFLSLENLIKVLETILGFLIIFYKILL